MSGGLIVTGWPDGVTSCRGFADWRAKQAGDMLTDGEGLLLQMDYTLCELSVSMRDGSKLLPELSS